jgi:hypothetical protein
MSQAQSRRSLTLDTLMSIHIFAVLSFFFQAASDETALDDFIISIKGRARFGSVYNFQAVIIVQIDCH